MMQIQIKGRVITQPSLRMVMPTRGRRLIYRHPSWMMIVITLGNQVFLKKTLTQQLFQSRLSLVRSRQQNWQSHQQVKCKGKPIIKRVGSRRQTFLKWRPRRELLTFNILTLRVRLLIRTLQFQSTCSRRKATMPQFMVIQLRFRPVTGFKR